MKRKLQVFVSSTYEDLKEDRQSAVSAILKSGHIPAGMELFTSGDKSQMETIRNWIEESDIYMLILGGRYGSLEPSSGVSYTELEYNYALELEKPVFAVVINEEALESRVRDIGTHLMEKENPKELKLFRDKVLSNISSFFDDEKDIRLCVYESLSDFSATRELKGWVSADEVANVQPLLEEISRLTEANNELIEKLALAEKRINSVSTDKNQNNNFDELTQLLESIDVVIPPKITGKEEEVQRTLLDLFVSNKEVFVTGITNQMNSGEAASFMYHNVCPKLQIHGLVINEKVASVQWRRFNITKKGNDYLAYLDRKLHLSE
ncbi:DUF4062 domain-containing protein [Vibrio sp. EA2]|uniref:DUF4062 domain-containing protein n=1 Tax=Vibrio sp. EA2 TaxID=3079860 RepID=UPI002948F9FA|nr:DUF4062 domain-containing protein [Vibrio sp. EA2]MDV6254434.1 DUF4062 domain-containing protein [Vibrio sp. EA2]